MSHPRRRVDRMTWERPKPLHDGDRSMLAYAELVHARLTAASEASCTPCAILPTIAPTDLQVSRVMSFCRRSGVSYSDVFSTRDAAD